MNSSLLWAFKKDNCRCDLWLLVSTWKNSNPYLYHPGNYGYLKNNSKLQSERYMALCITFTPYRTQMKLNGGFRCHDSIVTLNFPPRFLWTLIFFNDSIYSTSWKLNYFLVVGEIEFIRYAGCNMCECEYYRSIISSFVPYCPTRYFFFALWSNITYFSGYKKAWYSGKCTIVWLIFLHWEGLFRPATPTSVCLSTSELWHFKI